MRNVINIFAFLLVLLVAVPVLCHAYDYIIPIGGGSKYFLRRSVNYPNPYGWVQQYGTHYICGNDGYSTYAISTSSTCSTISLSTVVAWYPVELGAPQFDKDDLDMTNAPYVEAVTPEGPVVPPTVIKFAMHDETNGLRLYQAELNTATGVIDTSTVQEVAFPGYPDTDDNGNACYKYDFLDDDGKWYQMISYPDGTASGNSGSPSWASQCDGTIDADQENAATLHDQIENNSNITHDEGEVPSDSFTKIDNTTDANNNDVSTATTIVNNTDGSTTTTITQNTTYSGGNTYTKTTTNSTAAQSVKFDDSRIVNAINQGNEHLANLDDYITGDGGIDTMLDDGKALIEAEEESENGDGALDDMPQSVESFPVAQTITDYLIGSEILPPSSAAGELCFVFKAQTYCVDPVAFTKFKALFGWALYCLTVASIVGLLLPCNASS